MRANMRKVLDAFLAGKPAKGDSKATCSTDGTVIYSYSVPIAWRNETGEIEVLDVDGYRIDDVLRVEHAGQRFTARYSRTTASQVRACFELTHWYDPKTPDGRGGFGHWVKICTRHEDCRASKPLAAACVKASEAA